MAVATVIDALQRVLFVTGGGAGLRSGTLHTDYSDNLTITLTDCAFTNDVLVNGTVEYAISTDSVSGDVTISVIGTQGGTLHIEGNWMFVAPEEKFKVSGSLGVQHVAVLVPEA